MPEQTLEQKISNIITYHGVAAPIDALGTMCEERARHGNEKQRKIWAKAALDLARIATTLQINC